MCAGCSHVRNGARDFEHSRLISRNAAPLSPPGDARRLADGVRVVLTDEVLAARLRRAAAARALALPDEDAAVLAALAEYDAVTRLR